MRPYLAPGFLFTEPGVGFRPRISHKAPDALSGETLSVARFVAKDLGEDC